MIIWSIVICQLNRPIKYHGHKLEKNTPTVRETSTSRHNGRPIKASLKPLNTIVMRWSEGGFNWSPIMPRDASLSDIYNVWTTSSIVSILIVQN